MATYGTFNGSRSGRPTRDEQMRKRKKLEVEAEHDTNWPVSAFNTILNVCPQGHAMVVERFGALHEIRQPGLFWAIPFVDNIAYLVDMRERTVRYAPQLAVTKDNVSVDVSAVIFLQFIDAEKACYGASNPLVAVLELAKSAMRSCVGELELDQLFHSRSGINDQVKNAVAEPVKAWGMIVKRHEILSISTDNRISEAMDRQAAAERVRREAVLIAEGEKEQLRLQSEGARIRLQNESEGDKIRVENEARAAAESVRLRAEAEANAVRMIAQALNEDGGREAATLQVARDYISAYERMGAASNTIMMPVGNGAADVTSLMAQAAVVFNAASKSQRDKTSSSA